MSSQNQIAVLIAYFNNEETLPSVLEALVAATLSVDVFIIDDASTETPASVVIKPFLQRLSIQLIEKHENKGVSHSLSMGVKAILKQNYPFIAINDADDISYPKRFTKQLSFLQKNPHIAVLGSWAQAVNEQGKMLYTYNLPTQDIDIKRYMHHNNAFVHSTVIYRAEIFHELGMHDDKLLAACDYDFLRRVVNHYEVANLPEVLLDYLIRDNGISVSNRKRQMINRIKIQWKYFDRLSPYAYIGIIKSIFLLLIPLHWIKFIKTTTKRG